MVRRLTPTRLIVACVILGGFVSSAGVPRFLRVTGQKLSRPMARPIGVDPNGWPDVMGRVGPYGGVVTEDDARRMLADGLRLAVVSGASSPAALKTMRDGGAGYIDVRLWSLLLAVCQRQFDSQRAAQQPSSCVVSAADEDRLLAQASTFLASVERDPGVVGFWTLDDYPSGDVTGTLQRLRDLVRQSNFRSGFVRPTICGVGGNLDAKQSIADESFGTNRRYTDQSMRNVSPAGCDLVAPYFYGAAAQDDGRLIDWSMRDLLPYFEQVLKARGFANPSQVLLPVAHAFAAPPSPGSHFIKPSPDEIATQMAAYCDAGAGAMLFFTWQSRDADRSYSNDAALREGVQKGRAACLQVWKTRAADPTLGR